MTRKDLVNSSAFNTAALSVIVVNAVLIGLDTYIDHPVVTIGQIVCLWLFVIELALKFSARDSTSAFFKDGWNIFDIIIIVAGFIPESAFGPGSAVVPVLRVLRVFRVLRLVKAIPELRLIVDVLVRSVVSMKYIGLLAAIAFYVFAVIGQKLFGSTQPEFATLHESLFTLFRVLTQDNWSDLRYIGIEKSGYWTATIYHVSWIVIATFLLINLVVGAILNNYQQVHEVEARKARKLDTSDEHLLELVDEVRQILRARSER